mgnify:CR=1 FL=1
MAKSSLRAAFYFTVGRAKIAVFLINPAAFLKSGRYARGIVRLCAGQRDPDIDNRRRLWYSEVAAFYKMREKSRTEKGSQTVCIFAAVRLDIGAENARDHFTIRHRQLPAGICRRLYSAIKQQGARVQALAPSFGEEIRWKNTTLNCSPPPGIWSG